MTILVANWLYSHTYYSSSPVLPSPHNTRTTIIFVAPGLYFSSKTIISAAPGQQQRARRRLPHARKHLLSFRLPWHWIPDVHGRTDMEHKHFDKQQPCVTLQNFQFYPPPLILFCFHEYVSAGTRAIKAETRWTNYEY